MLNVAVRYEKATNKLKIMQCNNCKHFEHAKSSCFNDFRCIKCPEKHEPGQCQLPESSKAYCCNCSKFDHPANSPNCPVYIRLLIRRNVNNATQTQTQTNVVNKSNDGFVTVGKNGKAAKTQSNSSQNANEHQVSAALRHKRFDPNEANVSLMAPANNPHTKRTYPQQVQQRAQSNLEHRVEELSNNVNTLLMFMNDFFRNRNGS